MKAKEIRRTFLDFFESKKHKIVLSAPIVNKNDPTLMFTNAGMNQFKDFFLGNREAKDKRVADTQKCLRASGKHNDLEDVGKDSYHHTMFEMLGNWSFGDYFKKEAIDWAWELLTEVYKIPKDRLYITIFEGDKEDKLEQDDEAIEYWKKWIPADRILPFDRKDNFWEMGATGPCGPCSEIHVDIRPDSERAKVSGASLVNMDDPQVIEIWNLVFIQFNRKADRSLEALPNKHIDTGMGFERLCMVMQGKDSSYDTDIFTPYVKIIEDISNKKYTGSYAPTAKKDMAFRVIADHIRTVAFTIADGQLPSNTGAGYVIRRILRRAVRYYFTFLEVKEPLLYQLIPQLSNDFQDIFPEIKAQEKLITENILEEEKSFLRTLDKGLKRLDNYISADTKEIEGDAAFLLYDTYGFPIDLTMLIAQERGLTVDTKGFEKALNKQKASSQDDAQKEYGDWHAVRQSEVTFKGYDNDQLDQLKVVKYRTVKVKGKNEFHLVLNQTPFYPEGGGQVGDTGLLFFGDEKIAVLNTKKENELIIHFVNKLPSDFQGDVRAQINAIKRRLTENNHSATHLVHAALRQVLGNHVQQKGSLVNDAYLRFDFSHFQKLGKEEILEIEQIVNRKIRENIALEEDRNLPLQQAKEKGAMMLFGEKYGETVRMITFDPEYSRELCGGCHVPYTGKIGLFKITTETSVAAGVRRIIALTADKAEAHVNEELEELNSIRGLFKNPQKASTQVLQLQDENSGLKKQIEKLLSEQAGALKGQLLTQVESINSINFLSANLPLNDSNTIKTLAYEIMAEKKNMVIVFGAVIKNKPQLMVAIDKELAASGKLHAGNMIREIAKEIQGGGGGQPFFASAGGKNPQGIDKALEAAKALVSK